MPNSERTTSHFANKYANQCHRDDQPTGATRHQMEATHVLLRQQSEMRCGNGAVSPDSTHSDHWDHSTQLYANREETTVNHDDVLKFWFEDIEPRMWWVSDPDFDEQVRQRFGELLERAGQAELFDWRVHARGRLAEIIVLDQFSRNIHRGTPAAFAHDAMALVLAQEAVAAGALDALDETERAILLLPYMHSESKLIHEQAERLYRDHSPAENLDFEIRHKVIIDRFGRYPHRNAILGRDSTPEEVEFLKQPGSSF